MNKDKAIQLLERLQDPEPYEPMLTKDAYDAIQMAIDALSANGDTISRKAAIDAIDEIESEIAEGFGFEYEKWRKYFCDLPSAQSDVPDINVGDTISRQAAIDIIKGIDSHFVKYVEQLPPAQPEIIRCKDCKHWIPYDWMFSEVWQSRNINDYPEDEIGCHYCDMTMKANDFCSRGEKREVAE